MNISSVPTLVTASAYPLSLFQPPHVISELRKRFPGTKYSIAEWHIYCSMFHWWILTPSIHSQDSFLFGSIWLTIEENRLQGCLTMNFTAFAFICSLCFYTGFWLLFCISRSLCAWWHLEHTIFLSLKTKLYCMASHWSNSKTKTGPTSNEIYRTVGTHSFPNDATRFSLYNEDN